MNPPPPDYHKKPQKNVRLPEWGIELADRLAEHLDLNFSEVVLLALRDLAIREGLEPPITKKERRRK